MSGGAFDYQQYRINDIICEIERIIAKEESEPKPKKEKNPYDWREEEEDWRYNFSKETIDKFREGIKVLKAAEIYANRIDSLVSGDDGEESFHERLKKELDNIYDGQA